jgi:hypothetical protein
MTNTKRRTGHERAAVRELPGRPPDREQVPGRSARLLGRLAQATPYRVTNAERNFLRANLDDFEIVSERLLRDRATGAEYRVDTSDVLALPNPRQSGVTVFLVDDIGSLVFLRPRGEHHGEDVYIGDVPECRCSRG